MRDDARDSVPWLSLAALTALAAILRAIGLDGGLWYDEIVTLVGSVRSPLYDIVTTFPGNNQHTLFSILAHASVRLFGEHAWSLRLPAAIVGVASIPALFWFARQFCGRAEALLACLLLATSYHHVWFSQNARGYSTLAFIALISSALLLRVLRKKRTIDAVWYGLSAALGVYAHLTMVFLVVSHAVLAAAAAWRERDAAEAPGWRRVALAFVLSGAFTFALYSPVLLDVKQFFIDRPHSTNVATPGWAAMELIRGLRIGLGESLGVLAAGVLMLAGLWSYFRQSPFIVGLFLLPGLATIAGGVALQRPIFPRFLFFLIGFGVLIVVRGALEGGRWLGRGRAPAMGPALVGALTVVSVVSLVPNYRYPKQDFEGAMHFVDGARAAMEPVVTVGLATGVYREYYQRTWTDASSPDELRSVRLRGQRVWVLYTLESYIGSRSKELMDVLRTECAGARVFRGTLGGGDIKACSLPPVSGPVP